MTPHALPLWAIALDLAAHFGFGIAAGVLYFRGLWWSVQHFDTGRVTVGLGWMVVRFGLLGGILALASLEGAPQLLALAAGILVARSRVVKSIRILAS